mgnify:CR=1 FL=1
MLSSFQPFRQRAGSEQAASGQCQMWISRARHSLQGITIFRCGPNVQRNVLAPICLRSQCKKDACSCRRDVSDPLATQQVRLEYGGPTGGLRDDLERADWSGCPW